MSILNRLRLNAHLDDAAIAAIWTDDSLRPAEASVHPHLQSCAACSARFAELSAWLEDIKTEAGAEADEIFTPERLSAQRSQIFRRLEAAGRPARVIAFPKFAQPLSSGTSHASRWIAAAGAAGLVAAGLVVGIGLGQFMDFRHATSTSSPASAQSRLADPPRSDRPEIGVQTVSTTMGDEAFLADLDATLARPSVAELRALDEFTPRAGEPPR